MMPDADTIRTKIVPEIARATFARLDPYADYVVVGRDRCNQFITERLMKRLPVNIVGHRSHGLVPPHDFGIYRIVDDQPSHDEVNRGWVALLEESMVATVKRGSAITVEDLWANAYHAVLMRLESSD